MVHAECGEGEEGREEQEQQKKIEQRPLPPEILRETDLDSPWSWQVRKRELVSKGEVR